MVKKPKNHREAWTDIRENQLCRFVTQGKQTLEIAELTGRTVSAIYSKASKLGISLMPKDL